MAAEVDRRSQRALPTLRHGAPLGSRGEARPQKTKWLLRRRILLRVMPIRVNHAFGFMRRESVDHVPSSLKPPKHVRVLGLPLTQSHECWRELLRFRSLQPRQGVGQIVLLRWQVASLILPSALGSSPG